MTRDDFVKKWRTHLAGLALYGVASESKDGIMARAARALDIPAEVERLLNLMHEDAVRGLVIANGERPAVAGAIKQKVG